MVDISVGIAKATEQGVGKGMITCEPGVETDGGKNIVTTGLRNKKGGDYVDLLVDTLVQAPNGIDAEQEHRRFGDNFLAHEPVFYWSDVLSAVDDSSNRPACDVEGVDNPPDQVRGVPSGFWFGRDGDARCDPVADFSRQFASNSSRLPLLEPRGRAQY